MIQTLVCLSRRRQRIVPTGGLPELVLSRSYEQRSFLLQVPTRQMSLQVAPKGYLAPYSSYCSMPRKDCLFPGLLWLVSFEIETMVGALTLRRGIAVCPMFQAGISTKIRSRRPKREADLGSWYGRESHTSVFGVGQKKRRKSNLNFGLYKKVLWKPQFDNRMGRPVLLRVFPRSEEIRATAWSSSRTKKIK